MKFGLLLIASLLYWMIYRYLNYLKYLKKVISGKLKKNKQLCGFILYLIFISLVIYLINYTTYVLEHLNILGKGISFFAFIFAIWQYKVTSNRTRVRSTIDAMANLRRVNLAVFDNFEIMDPQEKKQKIKRYLSQMELFATGINNNSYDIESVNRSSGALLIGQDKKYLRSYIIEQRKETRSNYSGEIYCEYESMMKKLYKLRNLYWEPAASSK